MSKARTALNLAFTLLIVAGFSAAGNASNLAISDNVTGKTMNEETLRSLQEMKNEDYGPLSERVLEFLTIMDVVVNQDKQPAITGEDWAPLGELVDRDNFHRVGNFGEQVNWEEYLDLLVMWANSSWWKGYTFRIRELPATEDQPGLVYLESEERSNTNHPVREDGDYSTLASIAVYQFDDKGKITALHVYDQRPL